MKSCKLSDYEEFNPGNILFSLLKNLRGHVIAQALLDDIGILMNGIKGPDDGAERDTGDAGDGDIRLRESAQNPYMRQPKRRPSR